MPDLAERTAREQRLERLLTQIGDKYRPIVTSYLGYPPDVARIPESLWLDMERDYKQELSEDLAAIYLLSLGHMEPIGKFEVPATVATSMAATWADQRAGEAASLVVGHTRERLGEIFRPTPSGLLLPGGLGTAAGGDGASLLDNTLDVLMGRQRASMIATTETTGTISAGEGGYRQALADYTDRLLLARWYTQEDERVCPVCGALDGLTQNEWPVEILMLGQLGPPAHPNCRCYLIYELITQADAENL